MRRGPHKCGQEEAPIHKNGAGHRQIGHWCDSGHFHCFLCLKDAGMGRLDARARWKKEREANPGRPVMISISTRVPSKWRFTDLETGETWRWENDDFRLDNQIRLGT
jgi:hypothetical protein